MTRHATCRLLLQTAFHHCVQNPLARRDDPSELRFHCPGRLAGRCRLDPCLPGRGTGRRSALMKTMNGGPSTAKVPPGCDDPGAAETASDNPGLA